MSAQKDFDTKIAEDINTDSGFLSGPIDSLDSGDLGPPTDRISATVSSSSRGEYDENPDSGLGLCVDKFSSLDLSDFKTPTHETRLSGSLEEQSTRSHELFQQDDDGDTPLHSAAVHGCEKSVRVLTKLCPRRCLLDVPNDFRHTPLHLAVMGGYSVVARMLVLAGASISARDACGRTPVHIATEINNIDCLNALLTPFKEQPHRNVKPVLNQIDYNGQTCVHIAANGGHIKTLQTLIYFGANINAREGLAGWTALHIAARRGDTRLSQYLLQQRPRVEPATRDFAGRTARRLARRTPAEPLFADVRTDTDSESESDDDSDSEGESLFEKLLTSPSMINVA